MKQMQLIYDEMIEKKTKVRDITCAINDALKSSAEYQELEKKATEIREKKKAIENAIKSGFSGELKELDELKADIGTDIEQMTVDALAAFAKGEEILLKDKYGNEYTADFKVTFKKK